MPRSATRETLCFAVEHCVLRAMNVIMVIRHAEKPDGVNLGVDETGVSDEQSLIVRGWQRAGALPSLFAKGAVLPSPDRIYASAAVKLKTVDGKIGSKSKRPTETVSVLAAKLGLKTKGAFTRGQEASLVAEIALLDGTTLVCWQHEMIPTIAANIMGNAVGLPPVWPGDRFDVVWRFTRATAGAPWSFDQVCERLLPGDGAKPIV
jgi:hypothetical protein